MKHMLNHIPSAEYFPDQHRQVPKQNLYQPEKDRNSTALGYKKSLCK